MDNENRGGKGMGGLSIAIAVFAVAFLIWLWYKEWLDLAFEGLGILIIAYIVTSIWLHFRERFANVGIIENETRKSGLMVIHGKTGEMVLHDLRTNHSNHLHLAVKQYTNGSFEEPSAAEAYGHRMFHASRHAGTARASQLVLEAGAPVEQPMDNALDLLRKAYHFLLVGPTNAGKTDFAMHMHDECLRVYPGSKVYIADPHAMFNDWRIGTNVFKGYSSCAKIWYEMVKLVQERYESGDSTPVNMFIMDELPTQLGALRDAGYPVSTWFRRIVRDGRKAGVILVGLSTGKGVEDLHQKGYGEIRQSLLHIRIDPNERDQLEAEFSNGTKMFYRSPGAYNSAAAIYPKDKIPVLKAPDQLKVQQLKAADLILESGIVSISDSHEGVSPAVGTIAKCGVEDCEETWVVTTQNLNKVYCKSAHRVKGNRQKDTL